MKKPEPLLELESEDSVIPFNLSREQWEALKTDKNFIREGRSIPFITVEDLEGIHIMDTSHVRFKKRQVGTFIPKCDDCQ